MFFVHWSSLHCKLSSLRVIFSNHSKKHEPFFYLQICSYYFDTPRSKVFQVTDSVKWSTSLVALLLCIRCILHYNMSPFVKYSGWLWHVPANNFLYKANNRNTWRTHIVCSKLTSFMLFWCLYCCFQTYFTPFSSVSIIAFEPVNVFWDVLSLSIFLLF